ncbi:hypothetical protein [Pseudonocardia zijingensis]
MPLTTTARRASTRRCAPSCLLTRRRAVDLGRTGSAGCRPF